MVPELERDHESSSSEGYSSLPSSPPLSRSPSAASSSSAARAQAQAHESDDWGEMFPPLDKLTIFDYLDQLALPQRLERINRTYLLQKDKVKRGFQQTKAKAMRKTDRELERYREKYSKGLDRVLERWNDTKVVSTREKISFVVGVSNVFITGVLIGGYPLVSRLRILLRGAKRVMLTMSMFFQGMDAHLVFDPTAVLYAHPLLHVSKSRLSLLSGCFPASSPPPAPPKWLANAAGCSGSVLFRQRRSATGHLGVPQLAAADHLGVLPVVRQQCVGDRHVAQLDGVPLARQGDVAVHPHHAAGGVALHRAPGGPGLPGAAVPGRQPDQDYGAVRAARHAALGNGALSSLADRLSLSDFGTCGLWKWAVGKRAQKTEREGKQVRRRDKIAAGRPTSFTWLKKSYRNTAIGRFVHQLPETLQEPAFMFIQYSYAVVTMLPCPFWFYHGRLSAMFIAVVGWWSVYNGATYYSGCLSCPRAVCGGRCQAG